MSVSAKVVSVFAQDQGYIFEIQVLCDFGTFKISHLSKKESLDEGREEARKKLFALGSDLFKTFDKSGSLR
ncbi:hypothetical protein [Rhodoblastus sp.]|jgi:hypothetical protein|uniref:hypothetical protein n=1 Tax=Rhodoblastus sp. TaxID=1962975 RepID=UPI0025F849A0|nr:hypothetical protein [Rhodoblastus sp.]